MYNMSSIILPLRMYLVSDASKCVEVVWSVFESNTTALRLLLLRAFNLEDAKRPLRTFLTSNR